MAVGEEWGEEETLIDLLGMHRGEWGLSSYRTCGVPEDGLVLAS